MNKWIWLIIFSSASVFSLPEDAQKPIKIKAKAVEIDEGRGFSTYAGNAQVKQGSLSLSAHHIKVLNDRKSANLVIAKGSKKQRAHYRQSQPKQVRFIDAKADKIIYSVKAQRIQLKGHAYLIQGFDSFEGGQLDYDIKNDKVSAKQSKNGKQRVHFKISL
jgi:lipopolysaccharide export system protein LptA